MAPRPSPEFGGRHRLAHRHDSGSRPDITPVVNRARQLVRAVKILAGDGRIPKPLRGIAAVAVLPIPGPIDEAALVVVGAFLWIFYRHSLRDAWARAGA
jgi:hypothetical protein